MAKARGTDPGKNRLFYGDNLDWLSDRDYFPSDSVDLVYLDPPFNSKREYSIFLKDDDGAEASGQLLAFEDTWKWHSPDTDDLLEGLLATAPDRVASALEGLMGMLGKCDLTAYIVMMAPRLLEMKRVLKPTGSLFLHCDPTASHYLKILLDAIFDPRCFRNEIIWRRTGSHGKLRRFGPIHDVIFFYTKSESKQGYKWMGATKPYMNGHVSEYFIQDENGWRTNYYGNVLTGSGTRGGESGLPWKGIDPTAKGRHWAIPGQLVEDCGEDLSGLTQHQKLDRLFELGFIKIEPGAAWPIYEHYLQPGDGVSVGDIWSFQPYTEGTQFGTKDGIDQDVRWLSPRDKERLGYPTQKPLGLLDRIIRATTEPGDVVLDPFCGCGTTVDAAQMSGRIWTGIDISYLAMDLIQKRLRDRFGATIDGEYEVVGNPVDVAGARALATKNKFEFERWAVTLVNGQPNDKQVADKGKDGIIRVPTDKPNKSDRIVVSVKGGENLRRGFIDELNGALVTHKGVAGVLICLESPTKGMVDAASTSGVYTNSFTKQSYPKIQIITIQELIDGKKVDLPPVLNPYKKAARHFLEPDQMGFDFDAITEVGVEDEDEDIDE